jgi:undecaprenyl-phosphate galactose phosphotransferase
MNNLSQPPFSCTDTKQPLIARSHSNSNYHRFFKRSFDIVFALLLLPIIAPVVFVFYILVRRDGGPGMYKQARIGRDGKTFHCYKLRTMHVNAEAMLTQLCADDPAIAQEWATFQKLKNDIRITSAGAFLRKTSFDELPQIWNVLRGDMSFVGPRPFMPSQQHLYVNAGGHAYEKMRPGITGLWQIEGRGSTAFVERIQFDSTYSERMSFGLDLRLIAQTAGVVLNAKGE